MIDANLKDTLYGIAAALPIFLQQLHGHIINLSSVAGMKVFAPGGTVYSGTKFAVPIYRTAEPPFSSKWAPSRATGRIRSRRGQVGNRLRVSHTLTMRFIDGEADMKILMVLTSHDQLGNTGRKTGFWLEELAAPYYVFKEAGAQITLASPKGGQPPLDPKSNEPANQTDQTLRFEADADATAQLANTVRLDSVDQADFDTVFYPGGHGPMWDLAEDPNSIKLIESFLAANKVIALVCHAPGVLRHVKNPDGTPLVRGKRVTGFTDGEEEGVGLTKVVPFLVEDELISLGAKFEKTEDWGVYVIQDGLLITGQNPASSGPAAKKLLEALAP